MTEASQTEPAQMRSEDRAASPMRRRRRSGAIRVPHRAEPPMHRLCGTILRTHLLGPQMGAWI
eukprot:9489061-Pyramimonas_sp.AAC.1